MDTSTRKNILLGLFVTVGLILFIIGIFKVGAKNEMFGKTFAITTRFSNSSGLKIGSNVRFNGVKVGIVKNVSLVNDSLVQVNMEIEETKRAFITKNAVAAIASDGLMGDKLINITPGMAGGATIQTNDRIEGHNPINTDQIIQTLTASNDNVKVITDNLKTLTSDLNSKDGTIQTLYKDPKVANDLKQSFSNLNVVTAKVLALGTSLQQITAQMQHGHGTVGTLLNDTAMGNDLAYTINTLKETSHELDKVSGQLSLTVQNANTGKGTVGMLMTDTAFASSLQQSVTNIKKASAGLSEDMEGLKHSFLLRRYFRRQAKGK